MTLALTRYRGLLLDFGGVLTTDFFESIANHCERLGLPAGRFVELVTRDLEGRELYHRLERGEISQTTFEQRIANLLGVKPNGLVSGLLADLRPNDEIIRAVMCARSSGVQVGVISNSWGTDPYDPYESFDLGAKFDAVVFSGEVGLRKPDPAIYRLAADKLGVSPDACVFVDDIAENLPAAARIGMATVHHKDNRTTLAQLQRLFRLSLQ